MVNGKVYVISCPGICLFNDFTGTAHIVHVHPGMSFFPLELQFHGFLDAGTAHNVVKVIFVGVLRKACGFFCLTPLIVQFIQLVFLHLARITDDWGKIQAVRIFPDIGLFHGHAFQISQVLIDFSHGHIADIG